MRRTSVLLTAVGLLCWLSACSSAPDVPQPGASGPSAAGTPPAPSGPAATARPGPSGPPGGPSAAPVPSGTGELPGPLPFGARTLTGTVERAGECTMLLVGERRWALSGDAAAALRPGARVTVRGTIAPLPAGCGDREDLAQTVAVTRVDPA
ncbi:DUF5818 domain-containing protein [Micromonospora sp. NPDC047707]|uniref:DUF5818 domain-containing protein n=1 Tax=unclassified Micromonospora TaxID=2617518 RepID=UPI0012B47CAB|nr:DUF5818 domain-containing protein [Micromonospora sp. WMMC415]QGN48730.1 hypothetical protein GKC29_19160 [Micromonospora sp. WMMC415]